MAAFLLPQVNAAQSKRQIDKPTKNATVAKRKSPRAVVAKRNRATKVQAVAARPSFGQMAGLHGSQDVLSLKSSVALVIDQETSEILFSKNDKAVLPIASLTKLMTGLVLSEARLSMDELITITQADIDTEKGST